MIRLLYHSQAAPDMSDEQVDAILQSSRKNNPACGITGVLIHGGGMFMQVLEGPEPAVLRQYVSIMDDPRHRDCQLIHISPASGRMFDKWSMGVIKGNPLGFQHIQELRARRLESVQASLFKDVLRDFLGKLSAAP